MAAGIEGKIGFGPEVTYGTAVASTRFVSAQESITEQRGRLREPMTFGTRNTLGSDPGALAITGGVSEVHARPAFTGDLLRAALGVPSTSGVGPYDHVFVPLSSKFSDEAALPPYSFTVTRGALTHRYSGGQLNTLTFRQPARDALVVDTDWIFKDVSSVASETISLESTSRFLFQNLAVTKNAAAFDFFEDVTIEIANNLQAEEVLNGTNVVSAVDFNDKLVVTVSGTLTFRDSATYTDFAAGASDAYVFTWTSGTNVLAFNFPALMIDDWSAPISGPGRMSIDVSFTAEFDGGAGHAMEVTLTNGEATYA